MIPLALHGCTTIQDENACKHTDNSLHRSSTTFSRTEHIFLNIFGRNGRRAL